MHPLIKRLLILAVLVLGVQEVYKRAPTVEVTVQQESNVPSKQLNAFAHQITHYKYNKAGKLEETLYSDAANYFTDQSSKLTDIQISQYNPKLAIKTATMTATNATITDDRVITLTDKVIYKSNNPVFSVYADQMIVNDHQQQVSYQGNVQIYHLDSVMLADTLVANIKNDADKILTASGKKVRMFNKVDKIDASARHIVYYPNRQYVELSGDVQFISPQRQVRGDFVQYYMQSGKLEVKNKQGKQKKSMITIDNL
jgi:lipopolysaccharide transport protein LptA